MRRAGHSTRGVLPSMLCVTECDPEASIMVMFLGLTHVGN
jgi:hypothetical protein